MQNEMITKKQIEELKVGDVIPNMFGVPRKITRIIYKGLDKNNKLFAYFYQEFGEMSEMSATIKEERNTIY